MSTKIFNGYRLKKSLDLYKLHDFTQQLRKKVAPIAENLYKSYFAQQMIEAFDKNQYGFYDETHYFIKQTSSFFGGIDHFINTKIKLIETSHRRDPDVDFGFDIIIIPLKERNTTLLLLYTEQAELAKAFQNMKGIEYYYYQNSSDKPKNVSYKNWEQRRKDWDAALGGDGYSTPAESGFGYKPYHVSRIFMFGCAEDKNQKKLLKLIPTIDHRATLISKEIRAREWWKMEDEPNS